MSAKTKRPRVAVLRTASNIEVLLHCHTSPEPHPRRHAPAVIEGLEMLQRHGLITPAGYGGSDVWSTTDKGKALVERLKAIPLEVKV